MKRKRLEVVGDRGTRIGSQVVAPSANGIEIQARAHSRLKQSFFAASSTKIAPKLIGKYIKKDSIILRITEVEAYYEGDSACHARFGNTKRTAPLFGPGGHCYVYFCYGMHNMLNVTCDKVGFGSGCLIRACEPVEGIETIIARRGLQESPNLLNGPGKVGQALAVNPDLSNHPVYEAGGLELLEGPEEDFPLLVGPRVGIDYAEDEDKKALLRFAMDGTKWISAPKRGLIPFTQE